MTQNIKSFQFKPRMCPHLWSTHTTNNVSIKKFWNAYMWYMCPWHVELALIIQIARTLTTFIRHGSNTFASDWYLIDVDPRVFAIWLGHIGNLQHMCLGIKHHVNCFLVIICYTWDNIPHSHCDNIQIKLFLNCILQTHMQNILNNTLDAWKHYIDFCTLLKNDCG